jgi:hypothetical protein
VKGVERDLQCRTCALDVPKLGFPATSKVEFSGTITVTRLMFTAMTFKLYVLVSISVKLVRHPPDIMTLEELNPKTASVNYTTKDNGVSFVLAHEVVIT